MTTRVTVDAHAGWPVDVTTVTSSGASGPTERVEPGKQGTFYVHSTADLIIREVQPNDQRMMDFGGALRALKSGNRVAREGWNGKGMWLAFQQPDEHSKMRRPYIYMKPVDDELVPWVASQSDLLACGWVVVPEPLPQSAEA